MKNFRDLTVWSEGYELALEIYRISSKFPRHELHGLTTQMRRAAVSIPTNIAEGCGRDGEAELARFLIIAMGSSSELDCLLSLARDLRYIEPAEFDSLSSRLTSLRKMLNALIQKVKTDRFVRASPRPVVNR